MASLAAGCAGLRTPEPSGVDRGVLIARVTVRGALLRFLTSRAETGEAWMLDAAGEPMPGLRAGAARDLGGGYFAFVDLPPGRYSLVAASFKARGVRYRVELPRAELARRAVTLAPGKAAFLGEYAFHGVWPERDVALGRLGRIVGHWLTPWRRRPVLPRDGTLRDQSPAGAAETAAMRAAVAGLAGTQWQALPERRLRELGTPDPPKREGALRRRDVPLRRESLLAWRDTLKWGEPRRGADRLEWRRPGGEARLGVFFTTAAATGFAGWSAAELELRRSAAAAVEDTGEVYEVRVGTRSGVAARTTSYRYPEGTLTGSVTQVFKTETVLVPDGYGVYTVRLRAPREEFEQALPAVREFLRQLELGPPPPPPPSRSEPTLPFIQ